MENTTGNFSREEILPRVCTHVYVCLCAYKRESEYVSVGVAS